ncbi:MAG TPA: tRNA (guanosine(37)-N1)-methyltransferase TrmD [Candidatus Saccharimonadales bacterium]|nr:tRNA (guanosine(37)-N1)-methyltransferase TrmD [Candidatus Saccharimonadales bacterium]
MKIQIISLFPEMLRPALETSMMYKAKEKGIVEFEYINLRDYGLGKRKQVDDIVYGGGDGMLLKPEPLIAAIEAAKSQVSGHESRVILMTPRGKQWDQAEAQRLATDNKGLILVCGRYEGYDERITEFVDEQISIGDYVLTGGELPAMVVVDSVVRLLPGVLGGKTSAEIESFTDEEKTLEYPQYTRPEIYRGMQVPGVLLSGNHKKIVEWRKKHRKPR